MKKLTITLIFTCSWVVSYAQSNTQLNLSAASIKTPSSISSNVTVSSNINISGATLSSTPNINASGINISSRTPSSSTIIISGATSSSYSALNTSNAITQANSTNATVTSQNTLATSGNTSITTISPTATPIRTSTEKLVVVKTTTPPQIFHRAETPKPETIANLHKSTLPQLSKTTPILAPALASNHGFETIVRLSNKVNLALTSDISDTDSSTASIAKLVDTISSPRSSHDFEFALSMLKQ